MATLEDVLSTIDANQGEALDRLFSLLAIPSISAIPDHFPDCDRAADWLTRELTDLGFEASRQDTPGRPMVVGAAKAKTRDAPHVLFYGHYDVQPADPIELWTTPPFEPRLADGPNGQRIVARGACDDKGQLMTFIEACRAFRQSGGLPCNVTVLFEGEEETGSPSLPAFLVKNAKTLKADLALVCDTSMWDAKTPAITTMLRGLVLEEVVVHGAEPRPSLRPLRRRGDQPDPRARAHHRRSARRQRRGRPARLLRRRRRTARRGRRAMARPRFRRRGVPRARSASPFPRAKRAARRWR